MLLTPERALTTHLQGGRHMASNKANTPHPSQKLNAQLAAGPMPVKAHIYHMIAELNAAFERVIVDLGNVRQINYFSSEPLSSIYNLLVQLRAQANRELTAVLRERETANANHFENLYGQGTLPSPQTNTQ
jgi:hypothetical protein